MPYTPPLDEYRFLLDHVCGYARVSGTQRFAEAGPDVAAAVLAEAGRMAAEVIAPLQRPGDLHGARLEAGKVTTAPGFADAWRAWAAGGWVGISATPEHGGMGLPLSLATAVNDMLAGACLSFQICPLLSQGQIEALESHADDSLRARFLPKLVSGEWTGTMNLTEPQAGSDVGALTTRAEPAGDGSYRVTGQKIYISYGAHDMAGNILHLVLARLPDAPAGSRGISLFLVPKHLEGRANGVSVLGLETKLGIHAAPTAVMQYDAATGWLVGQPHKGLAAMFTMMNNARLGVGVQGIGVAEAACQQALAFATERRQGRTASGEVAIIGHPDVRRMLAETRATIFAARAVAIDCAVALDMAAATGDAAWQARAGLLIPVVKVMGTECGMAAAETGVQVHGGMGVIEETGAAQFARDVRVTAIYEGTNGIQAADLAGRKLSDGGAALGVLVEEVQETARLAHATMPDLAMPVWEACEALREAAERMLAAHMTDRLGTALPVLRGMALVLGAYAHLRAAMADDRRVALARVYMMRCLPMHGPLLAQAGMGADDLYALGPDDLTA